MKKQRERERERESKTGHSPTIPNSHSQTNDKIINSLEAEKKQLQSKIRQLEQQLNNRQFSEDEKKLKESELDASHKLLAEREKELAKLRGKNQPTNPQQSKNNDNSLKWAIGLGIVAVVISLFCFILLLRKRRD